MNRTNTTGNNQPGGDKPKRRVRYAGTHPKKFDQKYKERNPQKYPETYTHLRAKGKTPAGTHVPVLLEEVLADLRPEPGKIVADCTLGYGGHASQLIKRISPGGHFVGFDVDGAELEKTKARLIGGFSAARGFDVKLSFYRCNYAGIAQAMSKEQIEGFDIILADLGVSSMQVDDPSRGISYKNEGPLDMRMDDRLQKTGADLLASLSEQELSEALWELSDEPDHQRIAQFIVAQRAVRPITQTTDLIRLVLNVKGLSERTWKKQQIALGFGSLHPAARTFQTLRILVNDELGSLRAFLRVVPQCLRPGGRVGIISFHSGEDKLVKNAFREGFDEGIYEAFAKKAITPRVEEIMQNPRSSSAKFRWAKKIGGQGEAR